MAVLCVGLVCFDTVNYCTHYPVEDEDVRSRDQRRQKGGNAANTASVLSLLGQEKCELLAPLGTGMETDFVTAELDKFGVIHDNCVIYPDHRSPTSSIIVNISNGSRTIVHYRTLPELSFEDFQKLNISQYKWIHFEGRNVQEQLKMISHISQTNKSCIVSVELEKERPELANFIHLPDVLFVSKEYAGYHGYQSAQEACTGFRRQAKESAIIVCAWGDKGAAATDSNGQLYTSPVYTPPGGVVDTLGAGDTFIGAVIHKLLDKTSLHEAIVYGCRVAGTKCGMKGFDQLKSCDFIN